MGSPVSPIVANLYMKEILMGNILTLHAKDFITLNYRITWPK